MSSVIVCLLNDNAGKLVLTPFSNWPPFLVVVMTGQAKTIVPPHSVPRMLAILPRKIASFTILPIMCAAVCIAGRLSFPDGIAVPFVICLIVLCVLLFSAAPQLWSEMHEMSQKEKLYNVGPCAYCKKKTPEIRESAHESLNKWETCSRNSWIHMIPGDHT